MSLPGTVVEVEGSVAWREVVEMNWQVAPKSVPWMVSASLQSKEE